MNKLQEVLGSLTLILFNILSVLFLVKNINIEPRWLIIVFIAFVICAIIMDVKWLFWIINKIKK